MVARTQPERGLVVTFARPDAELVETISAADGHEASGHALSMTVRHTRLLAGDRLTVRRVEDAFIDELNEDQRIIARRPRRLPHGDNL